MPATKTTDRPRTVELGRYVTARGEERILAGRRGADQVVRLFDLSAGANGKRGRSYFVEAGFDSKAELAVFRKLYLEDAERIGDSPMSKAAIDRIIDASLERPREAIS